MDLRRMLGSQDNIRIMAYAGMGKTTALVVMCRRHPAIRFLLVVNKSVEPNSKKLFPLNAMVKTANALSYKFITETSGYDTDLIHLNYIPTRVEVCKGFSFYHNSEEKEVGMEHIPDNPDKWITGRKYDKEALQSKIIPQTQLEYCSKEV